MQAVKFQNRIVGRILPSKREGIYPLKKGSRGKGSLPVRDSLLSLYMKKVERYPLLSPEQEVEVARKAKAGDKNAYDLLVKSNLRFVVSVARRYCSEESQLMDMISEGNLGLLRAADNFDPEKGCHFISYAVWNIKQAVLAVVRKQSHSLSLPVSQLLAVQRFEKFQAQSQTEANSSIKLPGSPATAVYTERAKKNLRYLSQILREEVRLDADNGDGSSDESAARAIPSDSSLDPLRYVLARELQEQLEGCLGKLSLNERLVISMRYGLGKNEISSFCQISDRLSLSKERVRQIEKDAIHKIRDSKFGKILAVYL